MAALVFKVGTLFVRTLAKPLSNRFESYVMSHPQMRKRVIRLAQYLHRADVAITRGAEGKSGRVFVGDISEEHAVELASKFVSESFIFAVGTSVIALEYRRTDLKDRDKRSKEDAYRERVEHEISNERRALMAETNQLRAVMAAIQQRQEQLQRQVDEVEARLPPPARKFKLL